MNERRHLKKRLAQFKQGFYLALNGEEFPFDEVGQGDEALYSGFVSGHSFREEEMEREGTGNFRGSLTAAAFNHRWPVGVTVGYKLSPTLRSQRQTETRTHAYVAPNGQVVIKLKGLGNAVLLSSIEVIS